MHRFVVSACASALALAVAAPAASAQDALLRSCAQVQAVSPHGAVPAEVNEQFRFLCGQVVHAMSAIQPTVGVAFSGGAHTLGTATTIGRRFGMFPRVSATARVNAALADAPDLLDGYVPRFGEEGDLRAMGTIGVPVLALQGDVVVGVYNGLRVAPMIAGLGAVDLLGSVSFVPAVSAIGMDDPIVNVGVGARVGILRQGLLLPGISVSGMYRTMLGDVALGDLGSDPATGDPAELTAQLSTWSFRGGVSKGILILDLAAGVGYDIYRSDIHFDWRLHCPADRCGEEMVLTTDGGIQGPLRTGAWMAYGNVGMNFLLLRVVGEVGYQRPVDIVDSARFRGAGLPDRPPTVDDLDGGRFFLGLGIRLTL
jgi:hypothetical protein